MSLSKELKIGDEVYQVEAWTSGPRIFHAKVVYVDDSGVELELVNKPGFTAYKSNEEIDEAFSDTFEDALKMEIDRVHYVAQRANEFCRRAWDKFSKMTP